MIEEPSALTLFLLWAALLVALELYDRHQKGKRP